MRNITLMLGLFWAGSGVLPAYSCEVFVPDDAGYVVEGDAVDQNGTLIYRERLEFTPSPTGGQLTVSYITPEAGEFAEKQVDFTCNPTTPAFTLTDLASQEREGVEWVDGDTIVSFQGGEQTELDVPTGITIFDAGFDNTIKRHWDTLVTGEPLKVNYLFARDNRFLTLRLQLSEPPADLNQDDTAGIAFFKISANNLLFRLLSKSLYVGYDLESRALRYYIGPSNLPMMRDRKEIVITYQPESGDSLASN